MIKKAVVIVVFAGFGLTLFFSMKHYRAYKDHQRGLGDLTNKTTLKEGYKEFCNRLQHQRQTSVKKKYVYLNIWETQCNPCVQEMPYLDSLAGKLSDDIQCVFITEEPNDKIVDFLQERNIHLKHFLVQNDMTNFISGIYNNEKMAVRAYPLHIIMDHHGNILYKRFSAFKAGNDVLLVNEFKKLGLL